MAESAVIKQDIGYLSTLPLGSIIAWHRDFLDNRPAPLPPGWAVCNGQVLDDPESPYNGHVIPNLNGDAEAGEGGRFLRGDQVSGTLQEDQLQSHNHTDSGHHHPRNPHGGPERVIIRTPSGKVGHYYFEDADGNSTPVGTITGDARAVLGDPTTSSAGEPRHGSETRPVNMSVIWIMKVKQVTAVRAVPAMESHPQAPLGSVYVDGEGRVGIGIDTPRAALEVHGGLRLEDGLAVRAFTDDESLAGDRADAVPSERAVRAFVDSRPAYFDHRAFAVVGFDQTVASGARRTLALGFRPQLVWSHGGARAHLSADTERSYGGVFCGFADLSDLSQWSTGPQIDASDGRSQEWFHTVQAPVVATASLRMPVTASTPTQGEQFNVRVAEVSETGLIVELDRLLWHGHSPLVRFSLLLRLWCVG